MQNNHINNGIPGVLMHNSEDIPWRKSIFATNIFVKDLGKADGYSLQLVKFEPQAMFPKHLHEKAEFIYVFEGSLTQYNQKLLPGFVSISQLGTMDENTTSESGCLFLLFAAE